MKRSFWKEERKENEFLVAVLQVNARVFPKIIAFWKFRHFGFTRLV